VSAAARLLAALLFAAGDATAAGTGDDRPLLALARTLQERQASDHLREPGGDARAMAHELAQAKVPADAECARTLGAQRFAALHARLGNTLLGDGDFTGAAAAFRRALACRPRDATLHERLADASFAARDYLTARTAVREGLGLDPRSPDLKRQAGNLDFVAGSWADAAAHFRYVAAGDPVRAQSEFAQLMFWLAQRRAGVPEPHYVPRAHDETAWPRPLMRFLAGDLSETQLVAFVRADDPGDYDEEEDEPGYGAARRLCQALFYAGEAHWARGDTALAREHLAAAITLKEFDLVEHRLAMAEISKLR
jgi:lipoprotein NlpI